MLLLIRSMKELNFSGLMAVYEESNRENGEEFFPELPAGQQLLQAEQSYYQYLREAFFATEGAFYALWSVNGQYVSALRLEPYRDGFLLEALETAPEHRRKGYASALIREVLAQPDILKIYAHVHKKNYPSLRTHERCGFQRTAEHAVYIDGSVHSNCCTLCYEKTAR